MKPDSARYSRRALLRAAGVAGLTVAAGKALAGCSTGTPRPTARDFLAGDRFYVAHRGSANEAPEHTLAAYTHAVDRGAQAVEISVHRTRDGVLVCHHDATLERTCAGRPGEIGNMDHAELADVRVDMTRFVGPAWGVQPIPRLDAVLDAIGGRTVLFVEPKDPAAAPDVIDLITSRRLQDTTVFKQHYGHQGDEAARSAGLAVWNYFGVRTTPAQVAALAARSDAIGADANNDPLDPDRLALVDAAVATGTPVIAWAVDRRHQVDQLAARGVRGFMASSWAYLARDLPVENRDGFADQRRRPGDLPSTPDERTALNWGSDNSIALADPTAAESLSVGSMCPLPDAAYSVAFEMRFDALPAERSQHAGMVINRVDDAPYRFGMTGPSGGQLVLLRANGSLELRQIPPDNDRSVLIAGIAGQPVVPGRWESIRIRVRGSTVEVTRTPTDGRPVVLAGNVAGTGRHFCLTRNFGGDGSSVRFRNVLVAPASA